MADVDRFFRDFPLSYIRRSPNNQRIPNSPSSLSEARSYLLSSLPNSQFEQDDPSSFPLHSLYLACIGEFSSTYDFPADPSTSVINMFKNGLISASTYGFLNEMKPIERSRRISYQIKDVSSLSHSALRRFCFSHGAKVGSEVSTEELLRMARWIISNEVDHVMFVKMPQFMQSAIDLSVMAQNVDLLTAGLMSKSEIDSALDSEIAASERSLRKVESCLRSSLEMNDRLRSDGRSVPASAFQCRCLSFLQGSQIGADRDFFSETDVEASNEEEEKKTAGEEEEAREG